MKKRTIISIFTFLLVAAVVAGTLAAFSDGFKNWDVMTWFNNCTSGDEDKTTEVKSPAPVTDGNGNALDSDKVYPLPKAVYFGASAPASVSEPQTATFSVNPKPFYTDYTEVDWSLSWGSRPSGWGNNWANGKTVTDYVTVTPHSDGATTAQVSCVAAFGVPIILTCTSRRNNEISVSATLDYYYRPTSSSVGGEFRFSGYTNIDPNSALIPFDSEIIVDVGATNGLIVGTVSDDYIFEVSIGFSEEFSDYMSNEYYPAGYSQPLGYFWGTEYSSLYALDQILDSDFDYPQFAFTFNEKTMKDMGLIDPLVGESNGTFTEVNILEFFMDGIKKYTAASQYNEVLRLKLFATGKNTRVSAEHIYTLPIDPDTLFVEIEGLEFSGQDSFIF